MSQEVPNCKVSDYCHDCLDKETCDAYLTSEAYANIEYINKTEV